MLVIDTASLLFNIIIDINNSQLYVFKYSYRIWIILKSLYLSHGGILTGMTFSGQRITFSEFLLLTRTISSESLCCKK